MQQQKIEFRKEREFGSVLGDSLKFLKQNFKSFFTSILLIVGPFLLLMGLTYAYMQMTVTKNVLSNPGNPLGIFTTDYFLSIAVTMFCSLLANVLLSSVVYNFMLIYNEKPVGEKIMVSEVSKRLWSNIGFLMISFLTFIFVFAAILSIIVLMGIGIVSILGIAGGVLVFLAAFALIAIYSPVIFYVIPASFYVVIRDHEFIFAAVGKVRNYLSGNFWWTWLIMIVTILSLGVLQFLFNLPASALTMIDMFSRANITDSGNGGDHSFLLTIFYTLGIFLTYCTSSISHVISAFNFMSHEEKHEGKGMLSRIDEIG